MAIDRSEFNEVSKALGGPDLLAVPLPSKEEEDFYAGFDKQVIQIPKQSLADWMDLAARWEKKFYEMRARANRLERELEDLRASECGEEPPTCGKHGDF